MYAFLILSTSLKEKKKTIETNHL